MQKIVCASFALTFASFGGAQAAPAWLLPQAAPRIILVANGCGLGFFRTIAGECVPNRRVVVGSGRRIVLPPPCPPGFLRDPNPARPLCYPRY